jgi:hypothetical protein
VFGFDNFQQRAFGNDRAEILAYRGHGAFQCCNVFPGRFFAVFPDADRVASGR